MVDGDAVKLFDNWIAQLRPQRKFVKEWLFEDLARDLEGLGPSRSHEVGARLFNELGCVQCHRLAGAGGGAGPDLSSIANERTPQELLESILEPSKKIAAEFAATVVITSDGRTLHGRVSSENDREIVLHVEDSLSPPVTIRKDNIEDRQLSTASTMPKGLLDTLQKSEILDLLAYLIANGDQKHPAFAK
jgi:putative heme-binding domain-containing protein